MFELFGDFQKGEMKSSFILWAHLCSRNMAVGSSFHPPGIPHSMSTQSLWLGGAAVRGRLFQMLLVVSSGGLLCVWWGAVRTCCPHHVVRLELVARNPQHIRSSLHCLWNHGAVGGGRMSLDTWPFAPGSKPNLCILSQACASFCFISIQMTYCSNGFVLHSNGLLTTWCCFLKCCALNVGVVLSLKKCFIAKAIFGSTPFFLVVTQFWAALWY